MIFRGKNKAALFIALLLMTALQSPAFSEDEEGGGGGQEAIQALALLSSSIAGPLITGIQANADKNNNARNNQTQITMGQMASQTSMYQSASAARTSAMQTTTQLLLNQQNKEADKSNLMAVLREQAAQRNMQFELQRQKNQNDFQMKMAELDLDRERIYQERKLAQYQIEAGKIASGMSTGTTAVGTPILASTPVTNAVTPATPTINLRLFSNIGGGTPSRQPSLGVTGLAMGSTMASRQRTGSDIAQFQRAVTSRAVAFNESGWARHAVSGARAVTSTPSHVGVRRSEVVRIGR